MKFRVTMKDPDTLHDAIREAVGKHIKEIGITDEDEIEALVDSRVEKVQKLCNAWFDYGEYLTVEIDTEAKAIHVVTRTE